MPASVEKARFLMGAPGDYVVEDVINPGMKGYLYCASCQRARLQRQGLHVVPICRATVDLIAPQPGLPDLVPPTRRFCWFPELCS